MELHKEEIIDLSFKDSAWNDEMLNDMTESNISLGFIKEGLKTFQELFDDYYHHSDKPSVAEQFSKLNAMLSEFNDEVHLFKKNICDYYGE
ncbi:unnamed protein product [marine sediment metagenome]|uniref:Uncharacterized protein n=1 Tax=marine sediment metagenome TaxID=412755 RepID=X1CQG8_9ZZZZ